MLQQQQQQRRRRPSLRTLQRTLRYRRRQQRHLSFHYAAATTTSSDTERNDDEDDDNVTTCNQWTRPTLDIAIPALIGMMADPLLSLMDTAFVGRLGAIELASLGACTSIFHLAFNAFRATTTATTSLVSCALQEDPRRAKEVTRPSLSFGIIMGVVVLVVLRSCGTWCLNVMGIAQSSPLFQPAHLYLNTRLWAAPAVLGIVVAEGAFRGYANTRIPLAASIVAATINLVLDPLLMFPPIGWGVVGAAAATALSQVGAASVYAYFLKRQQMLPSKQKQQQQQQKEEASSSHGGASLTWDNVIVLLRSIVGANVAMFAKQGSLLLAWAYATSRATRLGPTHVAAHQVALSFWLVFALLLDGAAVSAQVLMSKAYNKNNNITVGGSDGGSTANPTDEQQQQENDNKSDNDNNNDSQTQQAVQSLSKYMIKLGIGQGLVSTMLIAVLGSFVPQLFTTDTTIQYHLHRLMPHLAMQQPLISLTLVLEGMVAGANQFTLLAIGTTLSTILAVIRLKHSSDVISIWSHGIVTLFLGRLLTSMIGIIKVNGGLLFGRQQKLQQQQ